MKEGLKEEIINWRETYKLLFLLTVGDITGTISILMKKGITLWSILGLLTSIHLGVIVLFVWRRLEKITYELKSIKEK
ncbi:hypothetical protein GFV12_00810 [Desulfurobacterium thermolithotrophum]|uniref:hypothetical protein n=1 Tax=Desulfurobacterium thermolithotrophum TaxID=64160 RepID=UPI0013CFB96E|nr:hypothetical protein [Desulfurobacterium thermolithotrophum]